MSVDCGDVRDMVDADHELKETTTNTKPDFGLGITHMEDNTAGNVTGPTTMSPKLPSVSEIGQINTTISYAPFTSETDSINENEGEITTQTETQTQPYDQINRNNFNESKGVDIYNANIKPSRIASDPITSSTLPNPTLLNHPSRKNLRVVSAINSSSSRLLTSHSSPTLRTQRSSSWTSNSSTVGRRSSKNDFYPDDHFDSDDNSILFNGRTARMTQFTIPNYDITKDYDSPPDITLRISESIVSEGKLEIYKILGKKAAFLQCGKFVHPILPRLRLWRLEARVFVLPQPNPGKFWKIELLLPRDNSSSPSTPTTPVDDEGGMDSANDLDELENVLAEACCYKNVCKDEEKEEVMAEMQLEAKPYVQAEQSEAEALVEVPDVLPELKVDREGFSEASKEVEPNTNLMTEMSTEQSEALPEPPEVLPELISDVQSEVHPQQLSHQLYLPHQTEEECPKTPIISDPLDLPHDVRGIIDFSTIGPESPPSAATTSSAASPTFPRSDIHYNDNTSSSSTLDEILDSFDDSPYQTIGPIVVNEDRSSPIMIDATDKDKSKPQITVNEVNEHQTANSRKNSIYDMSAVNENDDNSDIISHTSSLIESEEESRPTPLTSTSSLSTATRDMELPELPSLPAAFRPSAFPSSFINHPLVPMSQLTTNLVYNTQSSQHHLRFRPIEDDWLEVEVPPGTKPMNYQASLSLRPGLGYLNWVAQITGDLVSSSSNYVEAKIEKRRSSSTYTRAFGSPVGLSTTPPLPDDAKSTIIEAAASYRSSSPSMSIREFEERMISRASSISVTPPPSSSSSKTPQAPDPQPDFYQQAVIVSGYMGWQLLNRVIPPWVRR